MAGVPGGGPTLNLALTMLSEEESLFRATESV
jgi:hypothetical protein